MPQRPAAIAFDVIETLFPLAPLARLLPALGLPEHALAAWFAASLRDFFALGAIGQFQPLRQVMSAVLDEQVAVAGRPANVAAREALLDAMAGLPAHPEAAAAIDTLRAAGIGVITLSNGGDAATRTMIEAAGLAERIDAVVTVAQVRLPKPRREVYLRAAETADVAPARLMLVACHAWDVNGARAAGLGAGFVARGRPYPAFLNPPTLAAEELLGLAQAIVALPA